MQKIYVLISILFIIVLTGCQKNVGYCVPPEFEKYIDKFEIEALKRGIDINIEKHGLIIEFSNLSSHTVGLCYINGDKILIDQKYWDSAPDLSKENIIFHELGHCILDRSHTCEKLPNGRYKSIMAGTPECGTSASRQFSLFNRKYFLDELFNLNPPVPDWGYNQKEVLFKGSFVNSYSNTIDVYYQKCDNILPHFNIPVTPSIKANILNFNFTVKIKPGCYIFQFIEKGTGKKFETNITLSPNTKEHLFSEIVLN